MPLLNRGPRPNRFLLFLVTGTPCAPAPLANKSTWQVCHNSCRAANTTRSPDVDYVLPVVSVPRHRLSTYGRRAFAVAVWNSLPEDTRDPEVSEDSHDSPRRRLYLRSTSVFSALEVFF